MFVPKELKLNRYRVVAIPTNREYFKSFGLTQASGQYSGDNLIDSRKNIQEELQALNDLDAQKLAEESQS